ncbi:MAG: penicillin-binding protein 2 [bacterium]|nr:penicillin-binding protein 2 [bacterium]
MSVLILFGAAGLIFYRLFYLTYLQHDALTKIAEGQYQNQQESSSRRGSVFIQDLSSGEKHLVSLQKSFPYTYSKKDGQFKIVDKNPPAEELERIRQLNDKEINIGYEDRRYYSEGSFLGQVLGFLGYEGDRRVGQYGLEAYYDEVFRNEGDLVLTIEKNIQTFAEQELSYLMNKWSPSSGTIIVQDPQTGAILAMAGSPSFDPSNYSRYPLGNFVNKAVQEAFEPGSSFKPITMSGAIDQKKVTPETTYFDTGEVELAGYKIKNFNEKSFGTQTMKEVLEKSLNLGAMFAQKQLGDDNFLNYVINFGFGQQSGIDLAGEAAGDISNLYSRIKINFATASFGQGISVTPIQLINAYSAIANGGKLMRPYVVKEVIGANGEKRETRPEIIGTPISEKTSAQMKAMLVGVVENGFDKASVKGYDVAGKTGTAQVASKTGGYGDDFIHNIVGFAPAFSPRFVVLIKIEKPQGIRFASDSLSASLGKMTRFLLNYFQIPPTR